MQAGKLRVLGWTANKRSPTLPDVPTMAEAGYPGIELEIWQGIVAPPGMPPALIAQAERGVRQGRAVARRVAARSRRRRSRSPPSTPEDFGKLIAGDVERLGKVVRDAGIKAQ